MKTENIKIICLMEERYEGSSNGVMITKYLRGPCSKPDLRVQISPRHDSFISRQFPRLSNLALDIHAQGWIEADIDLKANFRGESMHHRRPFGTSIGKKVWVRHCQYKIQERFGEGGCCV